LTVQYGQVNNYIQSVYLGQRRLLQSREDLVIDFTLDYSGIQIEAGDVITVKFEPYGWDVMNSGEGKLFRVSQVQEAKIDDGTLGVKISAFEYNATIYADNPIQDFVAADNTGLTDPNILGRPDAPTIANVVLANSGAVASFSMTSSVPNVGSITMFDFNLGNSSNVETHKLYTTLQSGAGAPFASGETLTITVNDQKVGTYYGSVTARTTTSGVQSYSSGAFNWVAGLQANSVTGGANGAIQSNTITNTNILPLTILGGSIAANTITYTNMASGSGAENVLGTYLYSVAYPVPNNTVVPINITTYSSNVKANDYAKAKYIDGTTVGSSYYYPYYQATSTIANGYLANSTSQYFPARASQFTDVTGTDYWYAIEYTGLSSTLSPSEIFRIEWQGALVSDADTTIQISSFLTFTTTTYMVFQTDDGLSTYQLKANQPLFLSQNFIQQGEISVDGGGIAMRNMVSGTTVDVTYGRLTAFRMKQ
jgi:hypothetical protein